MAVEIATAYVSIVPTTRGIGRQLERELGGAGTAAGATASRGFSSGFLGGAASRAIGLASGVGIGAGILAGINQAADFEQTRIAFEGILGDKGAAAALLQELREFANVTPFQFQDLTTSARQLLAVGTAAEDIIPTMTILGNQAAALGLGEVEIQGVVRALGQMKGKGKVSAEELRQISEQFPGFSAINAIAGELGVTVAEAFALIEKGAVPADVGIQAILGGMQDFPGAAGAMERQSKTLNGVISTFKDTLATTAIDFITPYLPAISTGVATFGSWIRDTLVPALKIFVDFIAEHVVPWLREFISNGLEMFSRWWDDHGDTITGYVQGLATVFADYLFPAIEKVWGWIHDNLLPVLSDVANWVIENEPLIKALAIVIAGKLVIAFFAWAISAGAAAVATFLAIAPTLLVLGALILLIAGIIWAYEEWDWFRETVDTVGGALEDVGGFLSDVYGFIYDVRDAIRDVMGPLGDFLDLLDKIPGFEDIPIVGPLIDDIFGNGGLFGIPGVPFLAGGGTLRAGQLAVVGEEGPEWFVPDVGGTVVPMSKTWRAGAGVIMPASAGLAEGGAASGDHIILQVVQYPDDDQITAGMRALRKHQNLKTALAVR